jgi:DNA polymerase-1
MAIAGLHGYTPHKANLLLKDLERTLPRLFEWREDVIREAKALGFVTTLAGRQRHLADINSAEWKFMARAERQAVNSKVQGSAADVVRRAMLAARDIIKPSEARICLQVHDEILWERGPDWDDSLLPVIRDICELGVGFDLLAPLVFEGKTADSWAEKGGDAGQVAYGAYEHLSTGRTGA